MPFLRQQGWEISVQTLLDDGYLRNLYARRPLDKGALVQAYFGRLAAVLSAPFRYDLLWIQWELFPWLPAWLEKALRAIRVPYVVDFDDAIFHRYDLHSRLLVRAMLGDKIDGVMRNAATVVVGNDYLRERAIRAGAPCIDYLPSVVDLDRYGVTPSSTTVEEFTVGWMGSPSTGVFLQLVSGALAEAGTKTRIIGAGNLHLPGVRAEFAPWEEETEVQEIQKFDVGIMPLPDEPWSRGKCGYKLIQYMACGKPVIASPVGVNQDIVEHGVTGYLATSPTEWVQAIRSLMADPDRARAMGQAARSKVESEYCLRVTAPELHRILSTAADRSPYGKRVGSS